MAFDPGTVSKSTVVLVSGNDAFARSNSVDSLLKAANAEETETESYQAGSAEPGVWLGAALTLPFFADRRVFIVRNIGRSEPTKIWDVPINADHPAVKSLKALPETTFILLIEDDELGDDERQRKVKTNVGQWEKIVKQAGGSVCKFDYDPSKTPDLIRKEAGNYGKTISVKAANTLSLMVSAKPTAAMNELAKAALYAGDSPEIRESDIIAVVTPDHEYNVFQLVDAIVEGQSGRAVTQMRTLFGQTTNIMEQALPRVFPLLLSQLRLIWQARFALDSGTDPVRPSPSVASWLPTKKLASEADWKQKKTIGAARKLSLNQLQDCIQVLMETEAAMKGQMANFTPGESLERMTLTMCRTCSKRN